MRTVAPSPSVYSTIVAAGAGVSIAKHGNRKMTSKSGSADVLASLGVNIEASEDTVAKCIDEVGIGFCFAPVFHEAMKHVGPIRRELEVPTIFNILGPLCNPAGATHQLLGVGRRELLQKMAGVLQGLGAGRSAVLHSADGLCEVSNSTATTVIQIKGQESTGQELNETEWTPEMFGLTPSLREPLVVNSPDESAALIRGILEGDQGAARDIVILNAAAAIGLTHLDWNPLQCARAATESIDSGHASEKLAMLAKVSHS